MTLMLKGLYLERDKLVSKLEKVSSKIKGLEGAKKNCKDRIREMRK